MLKAFIDEIMSRPAWYYILIPIYFWLIIVWLYTILHFNLEILFYAFFWTLIVASTHDLFYRVWKNKVYD